jgi:hypothetical protein
LVRGIPDSAVLMVNTDPGKDRAIVVEEDLFYIERR